jgi:hypothetical protein
VIKKHKCKFGEMPNTKPFLMKLTFISLALVAVFLFTSCKNSGTGSVNKDSGTTTNAAGMDNVNGNVPDTTSGMKLNQTLPVDSSKMKDSAMLKK